MYLLEPDDVWMQQGAMVDELSLNILVNLQETNEVRRQSMRAVLSAFSRTLQQASLVSKKAACVSIQYPGIQQQVFQHRTNSTTFRASARKEHVRVS